MKPLVPAGETTPAEPLSPTTQDVDVSIGQVPYSVLWSALVPGYIGVFVTELIVPGAHVSGDDLPVVITSAGVSSAPSGGPVASVQ